MDDHVGARDRELDGLLDGVRGRVALADGRARRDADDDVGEVPPRRAPHAQAAQGHARAERPMARRAASSSSTGAWSMSTSTFRRIRRPAATRTSTATKSAAIASPSG